MVNVNYYKWSDLTFHYVAMPMVTSQILKSVDFTKTLKSGYLKDKLLFFLQIKKFINYTSRATLWQKIICSRGNL